MTTGTFFSGRSEMHARMNAHDWASSPVGPVEQWPPGLRSLVQMLLASRYPMILTWGSQLTQLYNDAYSRLIGDKHPAALGIDIRITMAEAWDTLRPLVEDAMATGTASWVPALQLLLNRSGYREESYFSVSHAPADDGTGTVGGMLAVCSEVTEQVLGERRTRLLRDLSSRAGETHSVAKTCQDLALAMADHALDVPFALLYVRGDDGRTLTLCGTVGLEADGPASPRALSLEDGGLDAVWPIARAMAGEQVRVDDVEARVPLRGGPWGDPVRSALLLPIPSSGTSAPLGVLVAGLSPNRALDEGYASFYELLVGQVSTALRNARAYEEERRRAEQLAELDRVKTAFFSNVSHELRTPLTLILGPLEDLLGQRHLPEAARSELELVHRNAGRLLRLVNTLLDFSRLEAGRGEPSFEPTDLASLTAGLASSFHSAMERVGLSLTVDCPPLQAPAFVDREMWEKVVLNLISNAFKFTFEGGITVRLRETQDRLLLEVSDTGTGIPAAELPHLFERFHRVRGARGRTHEGTGIGLSLVRELVTLHGGEVRVESREGQGTTFTVALPRGSAHLPAERIHAPRVLPSTATGATAFVEEALRWQDGGTSGPPAPARDVEKAGAPGPTGPLGRILLADDNADMRDYVRRVLAPTFQVEAVADGQAALRAALADPPDLIVTDVMMPGLGGFGLLKALREEPLTCAVPVIMLSARAGEESAVEGLEAGADDYLVKPFSARELLARVRSNLELVRMRREVARQEALADILRESLKARDDFLAVASHELKTPLAAFRLHLELIERNLSAESRVNVGKRIVSAGRQVQRLHALVETLLDVSKITTGRLMLQRDRVDLSALVSEAVSRMQDELARGGSAVRLDVEGALVGQFDRLRIDQVVTNLLSNAALYGQGQPIEVSARKVGEAAHLTVRDNGIGISPEDTTRIFERFERAVSSRHYGGLGLGLWIVRQVVEAHGGRIQVDSAPGQGATFTVALPLAD